MKCQSLILGKYKESAPKFLSLPSYKTLVLEANFWDEKYGSSRQTGKILSYLLFNIK